jgi:hypothetical protein
MSLKTSDRHHPPLLPVSSARQHHRTDDCHQQEHAGDFKWQRGVSVETRANALSFFRQTADAGRARRQVRLLRFTVLGSLLDFRCVTLSASPDIRD